MSVVGRIVARSLAGWLRRRGWIVVEPSGVGAIAGGLGTLRIGGAGAGSASDDELRVVAALADICDAALASDEDGRLRGYVLGRTALLRHEDAGRLRAWAG